MKVTDCECESAGWCDRHQCVKSEWLWETCRRHPATFQMWERREGPGQTTLANARLVHACQHRGIVTREVACASCRGRVLLKVFVCSIHGECVVRGRFSEIAECVSCPQYQTSETEGVNHA